MTLVLVHGNPETAAIWDPMRAALERRGIGSLNTEVANTDGNSSDGSSNEVVALSPPGFGAPVPAGFGATMSEYRDWLAGELERLLAQGAPHIDLLGHDWGGGHVVRIAMERPDLIRSWCTDVIGIFEPEYEWHDAAQLWQSAGGEAAVAEMAQRPRDAQVEFYAELGMGTDVAQAVVPHIDAEMGRCVLGLYRDAAQPAVAELGFNLAAASQRPGLCLLAANDSYTGGPKLHRRAATRAGARFTELLDVGHWWMCEKPGLAAHTVASWIETVEALESSAPSQGP